MARKLLLSYDASVDWHYNEDKDFRQNLVEFILENGGTNLKSYVSSTIYFETGDFDNRLPEDERGLSINTWKERLVRKFGRHFYFSLAVVAPNNPNGYRHADAKNNSIETNFDALVQRVIQSLQ